MQAQCFQVELNQTWVAKAGQKPLGWVVLSKHSTRPAAEAEAERRAHQEGRGFQHRVTQA
jgi:hypothetical protein